MVMKKEVKLDSGFIKWFSELRNKDVSIAGGKGASLAEMYAHGFPVPPGFVVTAQAYTYFITQANLQGMIQGILERLQIEDTGALNNASKKIRALIEAAQLPPELEQELVEAYDILSVDKHDGNARELLGRKNEGSYVAVRSSATTEDLADASFAGQQDSFLGVKGHAILIKKVKECFSSLFTARAIYYRVKKGFTRADSQLAVVVQRMINSEKSGVMFSRNPLVNDDSVIIEAVFGLGEGIVSGRILPDHYVVNRDEEVVEMKVADKKIALVRGQNAEVDEVKLKEEISKKQVLTGYELKRLAQYGMQLEEHYKKPQDIEFAIENDEIYIVQSRPITTKAKDTDKEIHGNVLLSGLGASPGISSGIVRIVRSMDDLAKVKSGEVLVTVMTNPDMVVSMQKAAGIVTDEGGVTSHAAIVSREMGIPAVVGTRNATHKLKDGDVVTVDGNTGRVIEGKGIERKVEVNPIVPTKIKIKVIVDLPDYAPRAALSGAHGVGLVRLEGIIASHGKHPVWYLKNNKMRDYISVLSSGLKKIATPFKEIWVRTSDIRSDEYIGLEGAPQKKEGNPMLGNHGIRFSLMNVDLLEAELEAIKEIADEFSDKKFGVMMPQVISVDEVVKTKKIASQVKMPKNVKMGIMVETPAAVQTIEDFCKEGISFVSFGTNDLTQFTLALDRNNEEIQSLYSEMHPAVLASIKQVISVCKRYGVETSICGQAGSREEMVRFLLKEGIDSISVNADAAQMVSKLVAGLEAKMPKVENVEVRHKRVENTEGTFNRAEYGKEIAAMAMTEGFNQKALDELFGIDKNVAQGIPVMKEEDLILKALEDDYSPNLKGKSDIPSLNDAIPVSSDFFDK